MARACETCHTRKVKCDLPPSGGPGLRCSHCAADGIECRPHTRKRKLSTKTQPARDGLGSSLTRASVAESPGRAQHPSRAQDLRRERALRGTQYVSTVPANATSIAASLSPKSQQVSRSSFLGRSGYIATSDLSVDEDDAMQYESPRTNSTPSLSELQDGLIQSASAICLPQQSLKMSLIRSFLERGKPWMPIIDQSDLDQLGPPASSLLLTAILVAGSKLSTAPNALEWGEKCYFYAKALFFHASANGILQSIKATVLLHWWNPSGPEHVSLDSSSFWLPISVGLAHQCGLHREPDPNLPDARLRRRLWWTIVARDSQISTSHGRPRAVRLDDSNVRPLRQSDFDDVDSYDALIFIHFVRIISILGDITEHYRCGSLSERHRLNIELALLEWINGLPPALHLYDRKSLSLSPYEFKSRQLHVPYFVALIILYRSDTSSQNFSLASLLAASFVSGIFEEYIAWGDILFLAPASIFYLLVAGLIQISSHRYLILAQNVDNEVRTVRLSLNELGKRFPTAHGAQRIFENLLRRSHCMGTTSKSFAMTLSPTQKELFAGFGPDLCALWPVVFGDSVDVTDITSIKQFTPAGRDQDLDHINSILNTGVEPGLPSSGAVIDLNHSTHAGAGQAGNSSLMPEPTESTLDFTFGGLNSWWPDWTDSNHF